MNHLQKLDLQDKRVILRVDFNVPRDSTGHITDDTRIQLALPTIAYIRERASHLTLMSHLGRPQKKKLANGEIDRDSFSLETIADHLAQLLDAPVAFQSYADDPSMAKLTLLENTRFEQGEEQGDRAFAQMLAKHGDVYVNDAFGTAHRRHASTAVIAEEFSPENRGIGLLMADELEQAQKLLDSDTHPITAVIGGAKVSDKIGVIESLLDLCDNLLIGGAMAYTFIKAQGGKVGTSLVEDDKMQMALDVIEKAKQSGTSLHLPIDSVIAQEFNNDAEHTTCFSDDIPEGWMGLDIGARASETYSEIVADSKVVFWNGPMGVFEMSSYAHGTLSVAQAMAKVKENGGFSMVGGGDSVAAINASGLADEVSFISSGGGAMLEFLEGKTLPGVAALG